MGFLEFAYGTTAGRILLAPLTSKPISMLAGGLLDTPLTKPFIKGFVQSHGIDCNEYKTEHWDSFNAFFTRTIKPGQRPIDESPDALIAPCDALLSVYKIEDGLVLPVKQSEYAIVDLLQNEELAARFNGGHCLVFRLCVNHYHHYAYAVSGMQEATVSIPGVYHTVRPVALRTRPVFIENARVYTAIRTGDAMVVQMEVGAMLVGRIVNHQTQRAPVTRGAEKGFFEYGGSTIILLTGPGFCEPLPHLSTPEEHPVRLGEKVARILDPA